MNRLPTIQELVVQLTAVDWRSIYAIRNAEREVTEGFGRVFPDPHAVIDLVAAGVDWRRFVEQIVGGYEWYLDSYKSGLSGREVLEHISTKLPDMLASRVRDAVSAIDAVFREHTDVVERYVWEPDAISRDLDLYRRVPNDLREPLLHDLRIEGLLRRSQI